MTSTSRHSPPPVALRTRDVADLTVASGYPCISVLLPTEPSERMTPADLDRLQHLMAEVDRELREHSVTSRERLMEKLVAQVRRAAAQPTDQALALYVSVAVARTFRLPGPVQARAVVESTFATRPLVLALHRMPPHVVLVLHPTCAHLYAAVDGSLRPAGHYDPFRGSRRVRVPRPDHPWAEEVRAEVSEGYLRGVDQLLGEYRAEHPSPLVLAGSPHLLDRFCALSRNLERLAGRVATRDQDTALDLAMASTEAIEGYLRARREDALGQLAQALRVRPGDVSTGIAQCWRAMQAGAPGMLLVEENFISPGTPHDSREEGSNRRSVAGEVHDLVDDLMEQVILRGGQLALVRDGDLTDQDRIALISRPRRPGQP